MYWPSNFERINPSSTHTHIYIYIYIFIFISIYLYIYICIYICICRGSLLVGSKGLVLLACILYKCESTYTGITSRNKSMAHLKFSEIQVRRTSSYKKKSALPMCVRQFTIKREVVFITKSYRLMM